MKEISWINKIKEGVTAYRNKINIGIVLLIIIWFYGLLSTIFQPMLNDCVIFWAWAQQVYDSSLTGIDAFESIWEMKGILSRLLYYQTFCLTHLFFNDIYPYGQYIFHGIGIIEVCLLIIASLFLIPRSYLSKKERIVGFFLITLGIFTLTPMATLQPEVWGIPICLLSFSCLLRDKFISKVVGGMLVGLLFFIKTPMLLLAGSIFFGYLLITNQTFKDTLLNIIAYALTSLIFIVISLGLLYWLYPQEIIDIVDASFYQDTLVHFGVQQALNVWKYCLPILGKMPIYLPFLIVGGVSYFIYLGRNTMRNNLFLMLMWVFPYLYVVISNCYFQYHFCVFFVPVLFSVYLTREYWCDLNKKESLMIFIFTILGCLFSNHYGYFILRQIDVIIYIIPFILMAFSMAEKWSKLSRVLAICMIVFIYFSNNSLISHSYKESRKMIKKTVSLNQQLDFITDGSLESNPILHLNDGSGIIWIKNQSYLRYFYPLPIQRIEDNSIFTTHETYKSTKNKLLAYQGNWIVLDSMWFFSYSHLDITKWLNSNYDMYGKVYGVTNNGYLMYQRYPANIHTFDIYRRKDD